LGVLTIFIPEAYIHFYNGFISVLMYYVLFIFFGLVIGIFIAIRSRKRVKCNFFKSILYAFFFPFYLIWLGFILGISIFAKVKWKKIEHRNTKTIDDMEDYYG
jgi:hypothetical protein